MSSSITIYMDGASFGQGGRPYLELHALRAPVGHYKAQYEDNADLYDREVHDEIESFEIAHGVEIFCLGRSGRHICIEDTPANRRRYGKLQRVAIAAAKAMWAGMREEKVSA